MSRISTESRRLCQAAAIGALSLLALPSGALAQTAAAKPAGFAQCAICHKVGKGEPSVMGPNLWSVGGRKAGATSYAYSPAMKASKVVWTKATLTAFIAAPQKVVPGTKMAYAGQKDPAVAAAIATYLLTLK
ncbi:c-type cytochrome [Sphingobium algorifonticola]|uniref:C-type cytochrome n=1 Tax=Sphingobium algorifonticola TaxID=2008318 RepID=A0A437JCC4_9SPHN|nr:c-type cytochrome [Sphingobium algorifonticola]RVT43390.1 c-type cytochrome [Sphingobium algorifonticola]